MFSPFQFTEGYTFQYSDILYTYILRASGRICTSLKIASSYHDTCYSTVIIDCYFRSAETSHRISEKPKGAATPSLPGVDAAELFDPYKETTQGTGATRIVVRHGTI